MNNEREKIYLAALLHDIGKFYQRADTGSVKTSKYLKGYCSNESAFCPSYNGMYTHKHVLWTAAFIDDNRAVFKNLVNDELTNLNNPDSIINLAAGHHLQLPVDSLGYLIKKADCLSSGMDRDNNIAFLDAQDESSWDAFKKKRMASILETIAAPNGTETRHLLPVARLKLDKSSFAKLKGEFKSEPDYATLWNDFVSEFKFIQSNTYHAFSETLLNLLFKYTTSIPSSTVNFPDVSLFDHSKTTAAIAVCLYDILKSGEKPENEFLLVGGDFSGIQQYIHQIVSKYASKNLKGRSFYIRLLSDTIVRYLLKQLNLFQANIIYNSGGSFYILAPNTTDTVRQLNEAINLIEHKLFDELGNSLYVAIDLYAIFRQ